MDIDQFCVDTSNKYNTEIIPIENKTKKTNKTILEHARLSVVSYLRKNMIKCEI